MRYAPGKVPARPLPAAPSRPGVKPMSPAMSAYYAQDRLNQAEKATRNAGLAGNTQQVAGTRPGVKPTVTGAPDKNLPFVINNKPRPSFTGGPKPAPTGLGSAMQNNPRMAQNLGALGAGLGKRMGMKKGGKVSSASKRADGCAVKGKTKGKMV
jgi:hypothetical protein